MTTVASFIESPRFPDDISYGSSGGPAFFNNKVVAPNGQRKVNIRRTQPLGAYNVALGVKTQAQLDHLHAFFLACFGGAIAFRYKDWADFRASSAQGILKNINASTTSNAKQMYKRYSVSESVYFDRKIQKPVPGTVMLAGGTGAVDYTTGIVTGSATTWAGEFDTPVAFSVDSFSADISNFETYNASLPLEIVQL